VETWGFYKPEKLDPKRPVIFQDVDGVLN